MYKKIEHTKCKKSIKTYFPLFDSLFVRYFALRFTQPAKFGVGISRRFD